MPGALVTELRCRMSAPTAAGEASDSEQGDQAGVWAEQGDAVDVPNREFKTDEGRLGHHEMAKAYIRGCVARKPDATLVVRRIRVEPANRAVVGEVWAVPAAGVSRASPATLETHEGSALVVLAAEARPPIVR